MTARTMTAIVFKLCAILVLVSAVTAIPNAYGIVLQYQSSLGVQNTFVMPLLLAILAALIGIGVFFLLWRVANDVLTQLSNKNPARVHINFIEVLLLQLLGLYFVVTWGTSLPNVMVELYVVYEASRRIDPVLGILLLSNSVACGIGLWLLVKPTQWKNLLKSMRGAAT